MNQYKLLSRIKPERLSSECEIRNNVISLPDGASLRFDNIFSSADKNSRIFETLKSMIDDFFAGYNVCIMALGHKESGKLYTLYGDDNESGIFTYIVNYIYNEFAKKSKKCVNFMCSYFEISNGNLKDLISSHSINPKVEFNSSTQKTRFTNITRHAIPSSNVAFRFKAAGDKRLSPKGSKAHTIFRFSLEIFDDDKVDGTGIKSMISELDIVKMDFDGSTPFLNYIQKVSKGSDRESQNFTEISDSCLNAVLYKPLLGKCETALICHMRLSNIPETRQMLRFAKYSRSMKSFPETTTYIRHDETFFSKLNEDFNQLINLSKVNDDKIKVLQFANSFPALTPKQSKDCLDYCSSIESQLRQFRDYCMNVGKMNEFINEVDDITNKLSSLKSVIDRKNSSSNSFASSIYNTTSNKMTNMEKALRMLKDKCLPNFMREKSSEEFQSKSDVTNNFSYFNASNIDMSILNVTNKENKMPVITNADDNNIDSVEMGERSTTVYQKIDNNTDTASLKCSPSYKNVDNAQWKVSQGDRVLFKSLSTQTY